MNEAELLFTEVLGYGRVGLYQNRHLLLDEAQSSLIASVLKRRVRGEPLPYILGKTEFMGLHFIVNRCVLIPRPETEILIETALKYVTKSPNHQITRLNILDLGTGSGCIAVSLAKFLPNTTITATDISEEAIEIARQNALINNVEINFLCSDLFNNLKLRTSRFGLIVSNPPYVRRQDLNSLQPEISYEPGIALDGGQDGMDFYRRIIRDVPDHLEEKGFLIIEIGYAQSGPIRKLFEKSGFLEIIDIVKDYNNIDRVIVARKNLR